jgi:hypothetical protein
LACFDDEALQFLLPNVITRYAKNAAGAAQMKGEARAGTEQNGRVGPRHSPMEITAWAVTALVACLSISPVLNMLSPTQVMNTSFTSLHLVNTYGAFGSVGKHRFEIVFEGTDDKVITSQTIWKEYEFKAKPGNPRRRPVFVAPYQPRIDWQIWFAAMSTPDQYPWTLNFVWKLLHNDSGTLSLLANNPFPDHPPHYIRAQYYRYEFAHPEDSGGAWWRRNLLGQWLPPLAADDLRFLEVLKAYGWLPDAHAK